jgi:serine/threonine protein kinase
MSDSVPGEESVLPQSSSGATAPGETAPWLGSVTPPLGPDAAPGRVEVPGYEVLEELGRGGMGVVYRARHLALNRLVALKMILAGVHAGPRELARFLAEAEAVARLQHPHIVTVYEIGQHQGLPFFSLELCGGGSLHARLAGTPQQPAWAAQVVEQLARGMAYAH